MNIFPIKRRFVCHPFAKPVIVSLKACPVLARSLAGRSPGRSLAAGDNSAGGFVSAFFVGQNVLLVLPCRERPAFFNSH